VCVCHLWQADLRLQQVLLKIVFNRGAAYINKHKDTSTCAYKRLAHTYTQKYAYAYMCACTHTHTHTYTHTYTHTSTHPPGATLPRLLTASCTSCNTGRAKACMHCTCHTGTDTSPPHAPAPATGRQGKGLQNVTHAQHYTDMHSLTPCPLQRPFLIVLATACTHVQRQKSVAWHSGVHIT